MSSEDFLRRKHQLFDAYEALVQRRNEPVARTNGIFQRYKYPILTAGHTPVFWRYDLNPSTNPYLMERFGINATFNSGAIKWHGKYILIVRVEGRDRKSFFAVAESSNGVDRFRFWDRPIVMPETEEPDTNVYDMRVVQHQDGWIYGLFCTERKDPKAPAAATSAAVAQCGIARTKDLVKWERLPDLVTSSGQQRNVVLHPEFVNGKYALYTRPQEGFIDIGSGGGIGLGFTDDMQNAVIEREIIIDPKVYHTIKEVKNGLGPAPIKTKRGWLHLAHGVRTTAAGLRYVLYLFMTDLNDISKVTHRPAGYLLAPEGEERAGDVPNVVFSNGWITDDDGAVYIYYGSSDTRMHVATTTVERLVDYTMNTKPDGLCSAASLQTLMDLIEKNRPFIS
jgi:4-O-beta-D-mannosyl-D-glucose phosphorylase